MMRWRWALASQIGTSHTRLGTRKQDALKTFTLTDKKGSRVLCAMVCDGAGSAQYGGEGASLTCRLISQAVYQHFSNTDNIPDTEAIWSWIDAVRDCMEQAAKKREVARKGFACTLILLISRENKNMIVHIGDGAVVGRDHAGEWTALSWPENGEYASSTYFITDDPKPRVRIVENDQLYTAYALFSDGIEDMALNHKTMTAHAPFFTNMIRPLDNLSDEGKDRNLSAALASFLDSERVCERTDDDKSLILLSAA
ncbi:MAG: protein phosphatase 2C domain-containing protein [Alphaproteobacteria bacterium PRO2]|nr:protein phosphatase 2C domain-containing protein [Alphaproteobacteria bacterium PRO2]